MLDGDYIHESEKRERKVSRVLCAARTGPEDTLKDSIPPLYADDESPKSFEKGRFSFCFVSRRKLWVWKGYLFVQHMSWTELIDVFNEVLKYVCLPRSITDKEDRSRGDTDGANVWKWKNVEAWFAMEQLSSIRPCKPFVGFG